MTNLDSYYYMQVEFSRQHDIDINKIRSKLLDYLENEFNIIYGKNYWSIYWEDEKENTEEELNQ